MVLNHEEDTQRLAQALAQHVQAGVIYLIGVIYVIGVIYLICLIYVICLICHDILLIIYIPWC